MSLIQKPILTIAIPTYNRAKILDLALNRLFPQVKEFEEEIELIISDNASQDNTQEIIQKNVEQYNIKNIITFRQNENTGYFGNFKKCRELSNGTYFWLLSDNDLIEINVIKKIYETLKTCEKNLGAIYLHNLKNMNNFKVNFIEFEDITEEHRYFSFMLISSLIVYNYNEEDEYLFRRFKKNDFIGFTYFIQSLRHSKKICIIEGNIFFQFPTKVSFDIFKSWIEDISDCVKYIKELKILRENTINYLVNGYLERVVIHHVNRYLIYGNILGKKYGHKNNIKQRLERYYSDYIFYSHNIAPLFETPRFILILKEIIRRLKNNIYKRMLRFI